jgi:hypothetical protein
MLWHTDLWVEVAVEFCWDGSHAAYMRLACMMTRELITELVGILVLLLFRASKHAADKTMQHVRGR